MDSNIDGKNNQKRKRFITVVETRVNKILDALDSLGKCSNKKNYQYDEKDIRKIFNEIDKRIKDIRVQFQETDSKKNRFSLE